MDRLGLICRNILEEPYITQRELAKRMELSLGTINGLINSLPDYEGVCHRKLVPAELIEIGLAWEKSLSPVAGKFLKFIRTEGLMP